MAARCSNDLTVRRKIDAVTIALCLAGSLKLFASASTAAEDAHADGQKAPAAEEFEIDEADFRPTFSMSWAKRRR